MFELDTRHKPSFLPRKEGPRSAVFLLDSDEWGRAMLGRSLRAHGYAVVTCATVRELLLTFGEGEGTGAPTSPCLVLINSLTIGAQALDVVRALREAELDARVVLLTGFSDGENVISLLRAGATDYIRLPAPPDEVHTVVERVLALPKVG